MKFVKNLALVALAGIQYASAFAAPSKLPSVDVMQGFPDVENINIAKYCSGKNVIIVGLPGAFTPTWSSMQVPGYLENQEALKEAGIDEVIVYCVNDPAVSKFSFFIVLYFGILSAGWIEYRTWKMWYVVVTKLMN